MQELTKGEGVPSNKEIEQQLENLKLGPDVNRQRLSETGQEVGRSRLQALDACLD